MEEITLVDFEQEKGRISSGHLPYSSLIYIRNIGGGGDNHIDL